MATVYYINGTSNSGNTFGQSGYFYPLYLTEADANAASANTAGTSHTHTFEEVANITFYMPTTGATHASSSPPDSGTYSDDAYVSYTSPIPETEILDIGEGVNAGDTFDTWRKKTNDIGREVITNKSLATSLDTRLTRLLNTTGGEENIVTLTNDGTITANKTFSGRVAFSGATTLNNGLGIGDTGKIHVSGNKFKFNRDVDLDEAGATLKASQIEVTSGIANYNGIEYQWPNSGNQSGRILKLGANNTLFWDTEAAVETTVTSFVAEDPNPIGLIVPWTKSSLPAGGKWLACNGQSVSRSDYQELFSAIGTTYGSVDSNHFNVPDLRARVPVGLGTNRPDANGVNADFTLGSSSYTFTGTSVNQSGEFVHKITTDEMPVHGHAIPTRYDDGNNSGTGSQSANSGCNWLNFTSTNGGPSMAGFDNGKMQFRGNFMTGLAGGNSHTVATRRIDNQSVDINQTNTFNGTGEPAAEFIGAGMMAEYPGESKRHQGDNTVDTGASGGIVAQESMNIVQPFLVLNYIIKAKPTLIVEQNITATDGIQINNIQGTQVNLLNSESNPNVSNTIKMSVKSEDFEFDSGALKKKYRQGEIIETFSGVCGVFDENGNTVTRTVQSGTYTMPTLGNGPNGMLPRFMSDVGQIFGGISYTRIEGVKYIRYEFNYTCAGNGDDNPIWSHTPVVDTRAVNLHVADNTDIDGSGGNSSTARTYSAGVLVLETEQTNFYTANTSEGQALVHAYTIECVETAGEQNLPLGKIHWPVGSTYQLAGMYRDEHGGNNDGLLFQSYYNRNSNQNNNQAFFQPAKLTITALAG